MTVALKPRHVIICVFENIGEVSKALEASLGEAESVKTVWKPTTGTPVDQEKAESVLRLISTLEDDDDVKAGSYGAGFFITNYFVLISG